MFFSEAMTPGRLSTVDDLAGEMLECLQKLDTLYEKVNKFPMMLFLFTFSSFFSRLQIAQTHKTQYQGKPLKNSFRHFVHVFQKITNNNNSSKMRTAERIRSKTNEFLFANFHLSEIDF